MLSGEEENKQTYIYRQTDRQTYVDMNRDEGCVEVFVRRRVPPRHDEDVPTTPTSGVGVVGVGRSDEKRWRGEEPRADNRYPWSTHGLNCININISTIIIFEEKRRVMVLEKRPRYVVAPLVRRVPHTLLSLGLSLSLSLSLSLGITRLLMDAFRRAKLYDIFALFFTYLLYGHPTSHSRRYDRYRVT